MSKILDLGTGVARLLSADLVEVIQPDRVENGVYHPAASIRLSKDIVKTLVTLLVGEEVIAEITQPSAVPPAPVAPIAPIETGFEFPDPGAITQEQIGKIAFEWKAWFGEDIDAARENMFQQFGVRSRLGLNKEKASQYIDHLVKMRFAPAVAAPSAPSEPAAHPETLKTIGTEWGRIFGDLKNDSCARSTALHHLKTFTKKDDRKLLTEPEALKYIEVLGVMTPLTAAPF